MHPVLVARTFLTGSVLAALVAACGGGAAIASPTANSAAAAPPTVASTPEPTVFGPTAFADWTERQGFGGSSGLHDVAKNAAWLTEHTFDAKAFDIDSDTHNIQLLIAWLDAHPATACWASYHTAVRTALASLVTQYRAVSAAIAAGTSVPMAVATAIANEAQSTYAMPDPASCP
ncbi:MAG: hypothetical protein QOI92_1091 [Chloroflexota bacterium]|nr:hypothetical protein [Chloroflexota bacterium]